MLNQITIKNKKNKKPVNSGRPEKNLIATKLKKMQNEKKLLSSCDSQESPRQDHRSLEKKSDSADSIDSKSSSNRMYLNFIS